MKTIKTYLMLSTLLALSLGFIGAAQATIIVDGPSALDIDTDPAKVVQLNVAQTGKITDLNLAVNTTYDFDPPEVFWGNYQITLTHNDLTALVFNQTLEQLGLFDIVFDDEAANNTIPDDDADLIGDYQPLKPLSIFDGEELSGLWKLSFLDQIAPGDEENLASWSLIVEIQQVPEPSVIALFGMGLLGLSFARRRKTFTQGQTHYHCTS